MFPMSNDSAFEPFPWQPSRWWSPVHVILQNPGPQPVRTANAAFRVAANWGHLGASVDYIFDEAPLLIASAIPQVLGQAVVAAVGGAGGHARLIPFDQTPPRQQPDLSASFLLAVENAFSISGHGTSIFGLVRRGTIQTGDGIVLLTPGMPELPTMVTEIVRDRDEVDEAQAGQRVALTVRGVDRRDVDMGTVAVAPGSMSAHRIVLASIFFVGERDSYPVDDVAYTLYLHGPSGIGARVAASNGQPAVPPGEVVPIVLDIDMRVGLELEQWFVLRGAGQNAAVGQVTTILV